MRLLLLLTFSLFTFSAGYSQSADDVIDSKNINIPFLEFLLKGQIDSVRKSSGLKPLINHPALYNAAADHSAYLKKKNTLSHFQNDVKNKKTPQNRVDFYEGKDLAAGENVIQIYIHINTSYKHRPNDQPHVVRTYREAAYDMMIGWVNSPGHYANIITRDYKFTGISVSFNPEDNSLRGVQVFGIPSQPAYIAPPKDSLLFPYEKHNYDSIWSVSKVPLPHKKHAWKIKTPIKKKHVEACKYCERLSQRSDDIWSYISADTLYYVFENKSAFLQAFSKKKDGLALELVSLQSYSCKNDNYYIIPSRRNGRCLFNGKVQKPIYAKELETRIVEDYDDKGAICINMGYMPDSLMNGENHVNLLLIRKRKLCKIIFSSAICGALASYNPGTLPWFEGFPKRTTWPSVKKDTLNLTVFFDQNQWDYDKDQLKPVIGLLESNDYEVIKANIQAYASVEGTEEINKNLYNKRAEAILDVLRARQDTAIPMNITMQENWPLFFKQLKGSKWERLLVADTNTIREFVNQKENVEQLEPLLAKQRYAYIRLIARTRIHKGNIDFLLTSEFNGIMDKLLLTSSKTLLAGNMTSATRKNISRLEEIQVCLYYKYLQGELRDTSLIHADFPLLSAFSGLLTNQALLLLHSGQISEEEYFERMLAISEIKPQSKDFLYYYFAFILNHKADNYYKSFLTSALTKQALEILPERVDSAIVNDIRLFYHFKFSTECYFTGMWKKARPSLDYIYKYYKANKPDDLTCYAIANHFVAFQKYNEARYFLEPLALRENPDTMGYMLYLNLQYAGLAGEKGGDYYGEMIRAANILTREQWCSLFKGDCPISFQLFDYEPLRNIWCSQCESQESTTKSE